MKKDKNIPKFTPEEVEGVSAVEQSNEMKDLIADTESFFKEEDEADQFDIEKCGCADDFASNSSFLSGVLTEFTVYFVRESNPEKILSRPVRAENKADAKTVFFSEESDDVEITGIEENYPETEDDIPDFWMDEENEDEDDGEDYSEESPAYIYDPEWE